LGEVVRGSDFIMEELGKEVEFLSEKIYKCDPENAPFKIESIGVNQRYL
jgi:hypothetical protein